MRHLNRVAKLNKTKSHRKALFQNLANALFQHERITTTVPKAMELRRVADRLITLAKKKDLHSQRLAFEALRDKEIVKKLFTDIGDRYSAINGGYTRVLKIGNRKGDNAPMAMIELTQRKEQEKEGEKGTRPKKQKTKERNKEASKERNKREERTESEKRDKSQRRNKGQERTESKERSKNGKQRRTERKETAEEERGNQGRSSRIEDLT